MKLNRNRALSLAVTGVLLLLSGVAAAADVPLHNWSAPPTWTSSFTAGTLTKLADVGNPVPFIPITPCRMADTRGAVPAPPINGGGALVAGVPRNWTITGNSCGIPTGALAVSANFTVVNTAGTGFLVAWPQGGVQPGVAVLVYNGAGALVSNAAVVPIAAAGGITVLAGSANTQLIMDVNGYYGPSPNAANNPFAVTNNSTAETILAINSSTTCTGPCGVFGIVASGEALAGVNLTGTDAGAAGVVGVVLSHIDGVAGVIGAASGATGITYGVRGTNASSTGKSNGVFGSAGTANWAPNNTFLAGGRFIGSNGGTQGHGVLGEGVTTGVMGSRTDATGLTITRGIVGSLGNDGLLSSNDISAVGTKFFVEPHATEPGKVVKYISLEGPEAGTYFRGRGRFVNKEAVIEVPEDFRMVTDGDGLTVHVTPMGPPTSVGVTQVDLNYIRVQSTGDVEFSYIVHGVRRGYKNFHPIQLDDTSFYFRPMTADEKMFPGLSEELRGRLIKTGVYNADGSVNMQTAERLGWAQQWRDEEMARQEMLRKIEPKTSNPAIQRLLDKR